MKIKSMIDKAISALAVIVLYTASTTSTLANMNDEVILYLNDPLGSAVAAYDENGDLCWEETHTPYGDKTIMEDSFNRQGCGVVAEERGFTGHSEDFETDLVYMQQRYYDPTVGRFLSTDPVGPIAGDPRMTNRYSYAANNPYKYVDPDGRIFISGTIAAVTAVSLAYSAYQGYQDNKAVGAVAEVSGYNDARASIEAFSNGDYSGAALSVIGIVCKVCKTADNLVPKSAGQLGREGEATASAITGVGKNTTKFPINGRNRIPDQVNGVNPTTGNPVHVTEVKNVASQSFTRQLRDNVDLVGPGGRVDVFVRPGTKLSGPLKRANADPTSPINIRPEL